MLKQGKPAPTRDKTAPASIDYKGQSASTSGSDEEQAASSSDSESSSDESVEDPADGEPAATQVSEEETDAQQPQADENEYDYLDAAEEFHQKFDASYRAPVAPPPQQDQHKNLLFRMCNTFEPAVKMLLVIPTVPCSMRKTAEIYCQSLQRSLKRIFSSANIMH